MKLIKFLGFIVLISIGWNMLSGALLDGNSSNSQVSNSASSVSTVFDSFGIDIKDGKQINYKKGMSEAKKGYGDMGMKVEMFK